MPAAHSFSLSTPITSFPALMGSKRALIFLGQGSVFPCGLTLHMSSFLIPQVHEQTEGTKSSHLLSLRQTLWSNQHCNFNQKTVVKWISLRTNWNLDWRTETSIKLTTHPSMLGTKTSKPISTSLQHSCKLQ